jgi:hypothetical protein
MASSDPKKQNNAEFKLESLFSVKDKVALITGTFLNPYPTKEKGET